MVRTSYSLEANLSAVLSHSIVEYVFLKVGFSSRRSVITLSLVLSSVMMCCHTSMERFVRVRKGKEGLS